MIESVGRYEILEEIGQGGFAIVYRARDTALDRVVALKELRPILLQDTAWVKRFHREAKTIARLDHSRIVTIYDVFEFESRLFIVMRLVEGPSLEEMIIGQGRLAWPEAVAMMSAVAAGLDYAHEQRVLHRDLKPANILVDAERGPLLSDFGLAKLAGESSMSISASGSVVGTPHYIAPEVWEGQQATPQADIYALGCLLYEMLTGEKVFKGETPPAIMMAHFKPLELPQSWPEGIPAEVTQVFKTALAKKPAERYGSAGEMAMALSGLVAGEPAEAAPARSMVKLPEPESEPELPPQPAGPAADTEAQGRPQPEVESTSSQLKRAAQAWQKAITDKIGPGIQEGLRQALTSVEQSAQQWQESPAKKEQEPVVSEREETTPEHGHLSFASQSSGPPPSGSTPPTGPVPVAEISLKKKKKQTGCFLSRMMIRLALAFLVIVGALTVCSGFGLGIDFFAAEDLAILEGPPITENIQVPLHDLDQRPKLELDMGYGELFVTRNIEDTGEKLVEGVVTYNAPQFRPQVVSFGRTIRLKPEAGIGMRGYFNNNYQNSWELKLAPAPVELSVNCKGTRSSLELGDLALADLTVYEALTPRFDLSFSQPNRSPMESFHFKGAVSIATLNNLANARTEDVIFDAGVGVYTLDFGGDLQHDLKVKLSSILSLVTIIVPEGMAAQVTINGQPTNIDIAGAWQETSEGYILPGEGPQLTVEVNMGGPGILHLRSR